MKSKDFSDVLVIGAGSAGALVAARLSEDPALRVRVLEAGPDFPDAAQVPGRLLDANRPVFDGFNWPLKATRREESISERIASLGRVSRVFEVAANRMALLQAAPTLLAGRGDTLTSMTYPVGRVVGGSSAVNGALAMLPGRDDFDAWKRAGLDGWGWDTVGSFVEGWHASGGGGHAMPIEAPSLQELTPMQRAFLEACETPGIAQGGSPAADGLTLISKTARAGQRASSAAVFLDEARRRPNLDIVADCTVASLRFERRSGQLQAVAATTLDGREYRADQIVLAAGAINSPALLLRSGIGSPSELVRAGVAPLLELPGVGLGLQDHPVVSLWAVPRPGVHSSGAPIHQIMLQQRSAPAAPIDLQLMMLSDVDTADFPPLDAFMQSPAGFGIAVMLARPASRGFVKIDRADPRHPPRICLNLLAQENDLRRMQSGVRLAWKLLGVPGIADFATRTALWTQSLVDDDSLLASAIHSTVRAAWHATGTLRMGPDGDREAVVDSHGQLRGCSNVTVVDASVMPVIPGVPTNLACMLVADRLAAGITARLAAVSELL